MTVQSRIVILCAMFILPLLLPLDRATAQENRSKDKGVCSQPQPEQLCTASNTCGSPSEPCTVDVKRTANSAAVTADVADKKGNALFCVKTGTTVAWRSSSKNVGFLIDAGFSSPFEPGEAIIGGSDRPVSVVATKTGCYKYSAGACASGATRGMCKTVEGEIIVTE